MGHTSSRGRVELREFVGHQDPAEYTAYLRLKYQVFGAEQGWPSIGGSELDPLAVEDRFDERGRFWLAHGADASPIGVIRALHTADGFPHRELFERHLERTELLRLLPETGTINSLAVLQSHRGWQHFVEPEGWTGSLGMLLVLVGIRGLEMAGARAVLATAGSSASARLLVRAGFLMIDAPFVHALHPRLSFANVALVIGSAAHRRAEAACGMQPAAAEPCEDATALQRYFEACAREAAVRGSA